MKNIIAITLLFATTLNTMDYMPKKHNFHAPDEYIQLLNMDREDVYDIIRNTTINDLEKAFYKRQKRDSCFSRISRFFSRTFNLTRHY